jgi:hypothetical protein
MLLKILAIHCIQVLCQSKLCKADHVQLTYLMLLKQFSHLNDRKLHHSQVYIMYAWLCHVWCKYIHSHKFVRLLFVLCTILFYNLMHLTEADNGLGYNISSLPRRKRLFHSLSCPSNRSTYYKTFLYKKFTYSEIGPPLRLDEGPD